MVLKESQMVHKWLLKNYPTALQWKRVRLGPLPDTKEARMYMVTQRWADAIFIHDGYVNIVEAKLKPDAGAFGQLDLYASLFPQTPEFTQYRNWPIQKIFLCPVLDVGLVELASKKGIKYVVYKDDE